MPTTEPAVSVLMAVYNGERYLRLAINSVLSQDFADLELIIVDDASTDATPAIIASYRDPRVVYIRNDGNKGQTASLNVALNAARADLVARIDADDCFLPGKLTRQVAYMRSSPTVAVCGTWAQKIDAEGCVFGLYAPPTDPRDILFTVCHGVPLCHVSVIMRRAVIQAFGGYDAGYRYAADYDLWSRLVRGRQVIANIPDVVMQYRQFTESLGAVHKLGRAGDEAARIIEANVQALAGVPITSSEARAIALLFFPAARLEAHELARTYRLLREVAAKIYGRPRNRVRFRLAAMLFWGALKRGLLPSESGGYTSRDWRALFRALAASPLPLAACGAAYCTRWVGGARLQRMKEWTLAGSRAVRGHR